MYTISSDQIIWIEQKALSYLIGQGMFLY